MKIAITRLMTVDRMKANQLTATLPATFGKAKAVVLDCRGEKNGNDMVLSGNIRVNFSGHDVRHADGRQLQRLGIQPHIKVERTMRGIREGRDELLEAAIKFLQGSASK